MKNPITKLAVAAVITLGAAFGLLYILGPFHTVTTAYGMTDLPQLLEDARTLHVQSTSWLYTPDPNQQGFHPATVVPSEIWIDVPNLRTHWAFCGEYPNADGKMVLTRMESFRDRQHAVEINHTRRTVTFHKASVVQRRLEIRDEIKRYLHEITAEQLEHFVLVGQETIHGTLYNIWEREAQVLHQADTFTKMRCWLAPATGDVGRIYVWGRKGDENWRLGWCADTIERDIVVPESQFTFQAPEDYKHANTLETAYEGEGLGQGWYCMGRARVCVAINFMLDDGTVLVAWHSDDLQGDYYQEQGHLFTGVVPGGELPKLPMVVYGLKTVRLDSFSPPEATYVGRHLAVTKKDRWYYEWALYVPSQPLPASSERPFYRMLCRFNLPTEQPPQTGNPLSENKIKAKEFDLFVREAMAELSDDGKAPEYVTYENVIQWAKEARASLAR